MKLSYYQQLRDPRWQKRRLKVMHKAGFECQRCQDVELTLHVHHVLYRKGAMAWEYEDHELQCLCENCHSEAELLRQELLSEIAKTNPATETVPRMVKILKHLRLSCVPLWHWFACAYYMDLMAEAGKRAKIKSQFRKDVDN